MDVVLRSLNPATVAGPFASGTTPINRTRTSVQTYTEGGIYTVTPPVGYSKCRVQLWGAGGGGAGGRNGVNSGGGGGGGAYAEADVVILSGATYTLSVGIGGNPGAGGPSQGAGLPGTQTTWESTVVVAKPGLGGLINHTGGAGGTAGASTGTVKHSGGAGGTAATEDIGGGGGGSAGPADDGNNAVADAGGVAVTGGGAGGDGGPSPTVGADPGGGGGGGDADTNESGRRGGAGKAILTFTP